MVQVMNNQPGRVLLFGYPEEGEKFRKRHPLWPERFMNLVRAIDLAFTRVQAVAEPEHKFVYLYGRMCMEDFMEVLLVCGNGYGAAGMKLLRSLYEHTVTLRYLHEHPEEISRFLDYHHVQQHKLMKAITETFGEEVFKPEMIAELKAKYESVKEDFMVTDCEKCGTKKLNHSWNKLNFVALAKKTGPIGSMIVHGYFLPLRHSHSTLGGLFERLEIVDGRMGVQHQTDPQMADDALLVAHNCVLNVLEVQNERFKIEGLGDQLQICLRDYLEIWAPDSLAGDA